MACIIPQCSKRTIEKVINGNPIDICKPHYLTLTEQSGKPLHIRREPVKECNDCGKKCEIRTRGLCASCYGQHYRNGTYIDYPRRWRSPDQFDDDYETLSRRGYTMQQIADAMGITYQAVWIARHRRQQQARILVTATPDAPTGHDASADTPTTPTTTGTPATSAHPNG